MTPNNNLSVLPWYRSIEEQNAKKWWIYGKVYPLFTPASFLLPFQITREPLRDYDVLQEPVDTWEGYCPMEDFIENRGGFTMSSFSIVGQKAIRVENIPSVAPLSGGWANANLMDSEDNFIGYFSEELGEGEHFSGIWELPEGATYINIAVDDTSSVYFLGDTPSPLLSAELYNRDGEQIGSNFINNLTDAGCIIKALTGSDVIVFPGLLPVFLNMKNGQYYIKLSDKENTWYSEVFTVVNDIEPYLKLEWWDVEDFVMDAGTIVYRNPSFRNVVYLPVDIAKPEYQFEEEGETRDGYFFSTKQISEKRYKFTFLAPEYLLDVLRFVRMSDFVQITKNGKLYKVDTFLFTPEWEGNGDVAKVDVQFDTDTVAKKIGLGYIAQNTGDFNDDFNDDFNNE